MLSSRVVSIQEVSVSLCLSWFPVTSVTQLMAVLFKSRCHAGRDFKRNLKLPCGTQSFQCDICIRYVLWEVRHGAFILLS